MAACLARRTICSDHCGDLIKPFKNKKDDFSMLLENNFLSTFFCFLVFSLRHGSGVNKVKRVKYNTV